MAKVPLPVLIATSILAVVFLLSSMVLLSSIIAWLSVDFSGPLPHVLGFLLGILSLVDTVAAILLVGIARIRKTLGYVFAAMCAVTLVASIALFIPWIIAYGSFCNDCTEQEQTLRCVDECDDECCFTESSRPIAVIFIVFSVLTMLCGFIGVGISIPYMRYSKDSNVSSKRR